MSSCPQVDLDATTHQDRQRAEVVHRHVQLSQPEMEASYITAVHKRSSAGGVGSPKYAKHVNVSVQVDVDEQKVHKQGPKHTVSRAIHVNMTDQYKYSILTGYIYVLLQHHIGSVRSVRRIIHCSRAGVTTSQATSSDMRSCAANRCSIGRNTRAIVHTLRL